MKRMTLNRRGLLTAAVGMGLTGFRAARGAAAIERVLVVGDSQAQGLAAGLQRQYRHDPSWRVIDQSRIATGLYSPSRFNWPFAVSGIAAAEPGSVAVVMFGANDRPLVRRHGRINEALLKSFMASYGADAFAVAQALKQHCPTVIWVGHPIVRDPTFAEDMVLLNIIFERQSIAAGAVWFPSWPLFVDAHGDYAPYGKGTDGETTRLRADDGVHCTTAGYDVLAHALLPVIAAHRPPSAHLPA
jgi:hypothetical protein